METNEIIERLQQLAGKVAQSETSAEAQAQVLEGIQQLRNAITTPVEKLFRMRFAVCQNVCVRLAQELGILQALLPAEEAAPGEQVEVSAEKLSTATQTDELLVGKWCNSSCMSLLFPVGFPPTRERNRRTAGKYAMF